MRLIDLTMPIWEGAGYGEILPFTNSPVRLLEYMFYDQHGLRMTRMKLDGETGSPFMVPHQRNPFDDTPLQPNPKFSWTLDEIPLDKLILRDTVLLDIRAEEGHDDGAGGQIVAESHEITHGNRDRARRLSKGRRGAASYRMGNATTGLRARRRLLQANSKHPL